MRYYINFNKIINQLVPYYIGGRKLILYLQALMSPLRHTNDSFVKWAKETKIEASMTSQIFKFEWYLNRKFNKYFQDKSQHITITNYNHIGTIVHNESAQNVEHFTLYNQNENDSTSGLLYHNNELVETAQYSFIVNSPVINNEITETEYKAMLVAIIEKYRLANKTYTIIFNQQ